MDDSSGIGNASRRAMSKLVQETDASQRLWWAEELGAVLRHQLESPVRFDVSSLDPALSAKLTTVCASEGLLLQSFADLLHHACPPVELLIIAKDYAKICGRHPDSPLPRDVARVLYYASIASALVHLRERISDLDDAALAVGVKWCLSRAWLDDHLRALLDEAMVMLAERQES